MQKEHFEETLEFVNTYSRPSQLKITDMRFAELDGAPYPCILMKIYTNQGIVGFGEVRDMASKKYALMLKGRLLGENPCNVDKLFRRIRQFGSHGRQGGGVSGIEIALWDLAGKAYGVPVYQMLGGKFRDKIRIYCDTDANISENRSAGEAMGEALTRRMQRGYTLLKMDLGLAQLLDVPGAVCAPLGYLEESRRLNDEANRYCPAMYDFPENKFEIYDKLRRSSDKEYVMKAFNARNRNYDRHSIQHPFTGVQITEKGLDYLESYVRDVRSMIGYEIPLAIDHLGKIGVEEVIKLAHRLERYNIAWLEDPIPWQYTAQWHRLVNATSVPICTGEDIYLAENFVPLLEQGGVSVVHPDAMTAGGILETKKIGDLAQRYGVRMVLHQASTPVHALAAAHIGAATENFWACEYHANDVPWWNDIVGQGYYEKPLVKDGFITVPDAPGLGIEALNDEVLREHNSRINPGLWEPTDEWDMEYAVDTIYN